MSWFSICVPSRISCQGFTTCTSQLRGSYHTNLLHLPNGRILPHYGETMNAHRNESVARAQLVYCPCLANSLHLGPEHHQLRRPAISEGYCPRCVVSRDAVRGEVKSLVFPPTLSFRSRLANGRPVVRSDLCQNRASRDHPTVARASSH